MLPDRYIEAPQTLGQHIRKRRTDLGLLQRETAIRIGVKKDTIYNWEHGVEPELRFIPKIIDFLGYIPLDCPKDPLGRLGYYKFINGLSYEGLGARTGIHFEQLRAWLTGKTKPSEKSLRRINIMLRDSGHEELLKL
ncbi:helix-turn-helix domain-containing protein [Geomonas sp. Red69]|uniref:helix-turn-helix domain-containing protein n=1 Tax=Geomonas diazotrophica TaxID=2843197 RepID=UPI001C10A7E9|nr:helix-turn-helix transcriptional regulator [Geomonas diazotrophica]MBU5639085.1 helix-turn-helix domain-containing protein [Geomonas diazotrophica]